MRRGKRLERGRLTNSERSKNRSLRSLEWLNFFLADVQTGLGPFMAAYLAALGWNPGSVGYALTFGGLVTVAVQTPAGALVDAAHRKRLLVAVNLGVLVCGAFLLMRHVSTSSVYAAQCLIGGAGPFLAPTVAAITLGIVGARAFDTQFGGIRHSTPQAMSLLRFWLHTSATNLGIVQYLLWQC
jgi:MFS family permease